MVSLSIVVPVYAGEEYLHRLVDEIAALKNYFAERVQVIDLKELVFVDDAAIDNSVEILERIASELAWVTVIHLSRNFGQHAATIAGVLHTVSDWVVTMDEDLQHSPSRIVDLLHTAVRSSCDIVYANARGAVHQSVARDLTSRLYKRGMEWLTGSGNLRYVSSFRLIRGSVARAAAAVSRHDTYFDVTLSWFSTRVQAVTMDLTDVRYVSTGRSGYNLRSLLSHARRMAVSSQLRILRLGVLVGGIVLVGTLFGSVALVLVRLFWPGALGVQGWASQILVTSFFGGICVLLLGILIEYVSILVLRSHGKPLFFVIDRSSDAVLRGTGLK